MAVQPPPVRANRAQIDHRPRNYPEGGRSADATRRRNVGRAATVWWSSGQIDHRLGGRGADRPPSGWTGCGSAAVSAMDGANEPLGRHTRRRHATGRRQVGGQQVCGRWRKTSPRDERQWDFGRQSAGRMVLEARWRHTERRRQTTPVHRRSADTTPDHRRSSDTNTRPLGGTAGRRPDRGHRGSESGPVLRGSARPGPAPSSGRPSAPPTTSPGPGRRAAAWCAGPRPTAGAPRCCRDGGPARP